MIYPDNQLTMVNSEIEQFSKRREFVSEKIIEKEIYAIPGS